MPLFNDVVDLLLFISGFGILQGILLTLLVYYHPKSDRSVNKFLALYILSFSIVMTGPVLLKVAGWRYSYWIAPTPILIGPMLYLYTRSFKEIITWRKALPHFILFFVYFISAYVWVSGMTRQYPQANDFPAEAFRSPFAFMFFFVRYVQMLTYYFLSRRELQFYQKSINQLFSNTTLINLRWVKWLINGYIAIIIMSFVIYIGMVKYSANFYHLFLLNICLASIYIYIAAYKGITQLTVWQKQSPTGKQDLEISLHVTEEMEKHPQKEQTVKSGWQYEKMDEIITKIIFTMEREKIYQEPELTLQHLSAKIEYPSHQVSIAINEGMHKNFYDLVNGYRVEESKALLVDPKSRNFTILSVGFEAGFNSKTTFNTVFKKFTGMTPTQYRDKESMIPAS